MWEGILWLEGFLGFEPRVAESQLLIVRLCTGTLVRPLCLQGNAGRAPSLHKIYTQAFALQLRKITVKPQSG
jgi:hypothetical protein